MLKWALVVAALAAGAMGGTTGVLPNVTIGDVKLEVGKKIELSDPIEIQGVSLYSCKAAATGERCALVVGYLVSNLPDHLYTIRLKANLWWMYKGVTGPATEVVEMTVSAPPPKRRTRFIGFAVAHPDDVKGVTITYSLERLTANPKERPAAQ